jgi:hypothetical protein
MRFHFFLIPFSIRKSFSLMVASYQIPWFNSFALHQESGSKKLGANFEPFWLVVWPQVTNK